MHLASNCDGNRQNNHQLEEQMQRERVVRELGGPRGYVEAALAHLRANGGFRLLSRNEQGGLGILAGLSRRGKSSAKALLYEERLITSEERARLVVESGRIYLAHLEQRGQNDEQMRVLLQEIENDYPHLF